MKPQQSAGRGRAGLFLFGSLVLAVIAAMLVFRIVKKNQDALKEAQKPKETIDVIVAQRDLYMGLPITEDDVVVRQMIPAMVPTEGTYATLADILGRTPKERILANEVVREERIARPDAGVGLNAIVQPGKRAMTVATNTEDAVAGLLQPGNHIDVIVTIKPEDPTLAGAKWATDTILQGIKVLAVGGALQTAAPAEQRVVTNTADGKKVEEKKKKATPDPNARRLKPSITLEVTPDEAERLALAVAQGDIYVVLRSDIDILVQANNGPIRSIDLIGFESPDAVRAPVTPRKIVAPEPEEPKGPQVDVISGSSSTKVGLNADGTTTEAANGRGKKRDR